MEKDIEPLRVLVVDDEEALRSGVLRVLTPLGIQGGEGSAEIPLEVRTAPSGEEGLKALERSPADLILLDYKLPGMDGLEVLRQVRKDGAGPMVIMLTAYASLETAVRATKMGSYDFLAKPFTPDELRYSVRKAAEHILLRRHAERLASERRRIRFEFIRVLTHELKAPLDAIEGYLDILAERVPGQEAGMVGRCLERVGGMRKLILDLLDLTHIESGEKKRELTSLDLVPLLRRCAETLHPQARKRGISIELEAPEALPLEADEGELTIVFNNLLSNAVKYNRTGGKVTAALLPVRDGVEFQVRDTGIGIRPEDQAKLFKEFIRIRNSDTMGIPGSGLGLSTVRKLAMLYGGDVSVESRPGEGSAFKVLLRNGVKEPT